MNGPSVLLAVPPPLVESRDKSHSSMWRLPFVSSRHEFCEELTPSAATPSLAHCDLLLQILAQHSRERALWEGLRRRWTKERAIFLESLSQITASEAQLRLSQVGSRDIPYPVRSLPENIPPSLSVPASLPHSLGGSPLAENLQARALPGETKAPLLRPPSHSPRMESHSEGRDTASPSPSAVGKESPPRGMFSSAGPAFPVPVGCSSPTPPCCTGTGDPEAQPNSQRGPSVRAQSRDGVPSPSSIQPQCDQAWSSEMGADATALVSGPNPLQGSCPVAGLATQAQTELASQVDFLEDIAARFAAEVLEAESVEARLLTEFEVSQRKGQLCLQDLKSMEEQWTAETGHCAALKEELQAEVMAREVSERISQSQLEELKATVALLQQELLARAVPSMADVGLQASVSDQVDGVQTEAIAAQLQDTEVKCKALETENEHLRAQLQSASENVVQKKLSEPHSEPPPCGDHELQRQNTPTPNIPSGPAEPPRTLQQLPLDLSREGSSLGPLAFAKNGGELCSAPGSARLRRPKNLVELGMLGVTMGSIPSSSDDLSSSAMSTPRAIHTPLVPGDLPPGLTKLLSAASAMGWSNAGYPFPCFPETPRGMASCASTPTFSRSAVEPFPAHAPALPHRGVLGLVRKASGARSPGLPPGFRTPVATGW
eukprot:RCo046801